KSTLYLHTGVCKMHAAYTLWRAMYRPPPTTLFPYTTLFRSLSVIGPTYADANELTEAEVRERFAKERDCAEDLGFENVPNTEGEFVLFVDEHPELVPCLAD